MPAPADRDENENGAEGLPPRRSSDEGSTRYCGMRAPSRPTVISSSVLPAPTWAS